MTSRHINIPTEHIDTFLGAMGAASVEVFVRWVHGPWEPKPSRPAMCIVSSPNGNRTYVTLRGLDITDLVDGLTLTMKDGRLVARVALEGAADVDIEAVMDRILKGTEERA
jgi:hypothetical protein